MPGDSGTLVVERPGTLRLWNRMLNSIVVALSQG